MGKDVLSLYRVVVLIAVTLRCWRSQDLEFWLCMVELGLGHTILLFQTRRVVCPQTILGAGHSGPGT